MGPAASSERYGAAGWPVASAPLPQASSSSAAALGSLAAVGGQHERVVLLQLVLRGAGEGDVGGRAQLPGARARHVAAAAAGRGRGGAAAGEDSQGGAGAGKLQ